MVAKGIKQRPKRVALLPFSKQETKSRCKNIGDNKNQNYREIPHRTHSGGSSQEWKMTNITRTWVYRNPHTLLVGM